MKILDQACEAARTFQPHDWAANQEVFARTAKAAADGGFELFKTSSHFDSTAQRILRSGSPEDSARVKETRRRGLTLRRRRQKLFVTLRALPLSPTPGRIPQLQRPDAPLPGSQRRCAESSESKSARDFAERKRSVGRQWVAARSRNWLPFFVQIPHVVQ